MPRFIASPLLHAGDDSRGSRGALFAASTGLIPVAEGGEGAGEMDGGADGWEGMEDEGWDGYKGAERGEELQ